MLLDLYYECSEKKSSKALDLNKYVLIDKI